MTISIRPVLRKFPVSRDLLEQSELPFGVVVTPNYDFRNSKEDNITQNLSGIPKCQDCGAPHADAASCHTIHNVLLCYLCGRTSTITRDANETGRLFRLPLRLSNTPEYSLNAVQCPPIWLVVLDGSCHERPYWNTMSQMLQEVVKRAPPHVHIGLLVGVAANSTATSQQLQQNKTIVGVFDLKSAVPHIRHYYDEPSSIINSIVPVTLPHVQTALRSLMDYYPPNIDSSRLPVAYITQCVVSLLTENAKFAGQREITNHELCYAGVKLSFFLTQRPLGIKPSSSSSTTQYCWGGRVHSPPGQRFVNATTTINNHDIKQMDEYYAELGRRCADIAIGVDLVCFPQDAYVDFNLSAYSCLSHKSGAPPPVIVERTQLEKEIVARVPWNESCVFGAELRLRLSPGYGVEAFDHVYSEGGLFGPASQVGEHQLWRMGAMSGDASYTIDLSVSKTIQDRYFVEGLGQVALKPVIQICFAYTKVIQNEDGEYVTVRQMKIGTCPVPLARSMEELYDNLDTESLAVVLYHKVALASLQDGVVPACEMAQQWLAVLLGSVYRSAEQQFEIQRTNDAHGVEGESTHFIARERLLELEGELSSEDVLLGQGHERIRPIGLMVYLLLQCDPLRKSNISMDARCATLLQMASMPPSSLTRCIAPRLQLWGKEEIILDVLDLRSEAVQTAMLEYRGGTLLFLDTPHEIVVMDARYINSAKIQSSQVKICPALQIAVKDAAESYGVPPRIVYELDQTQSSGEQTMQRLVDCLIEDTPNAALKYENFSEFKVQVALNVQAYVFAHYFFSLSHSFLFVAIY